MDHTVYHVYLGPTKSKKADWLIFVEGVYALKRKTNIKTVSTFNRKVEGFQKLNDKLMFDWFCGWHQTA